MKETNLWQLCPKCNGSGEQHAKYSTTLVYTETCRVCNGKMIINTITGTPPKSRTKKTI